LTPSATADERQLAIQKAHNENMVANRLLVQAINNLAKSMTELNETLRLIKSATA
jgi:hypothetical protein